VLVRVVQVDGHPDAVGVGTALDGVEHPLDVESSPKDGEACPFPATASTKSTTWWLKPCSYPSM
jgi:hypothetical protein